MYKIKDPKPKFFGISLVSKCPYCGKGFGEKTDCDHPTKIRLSPSGPGASRSRPKQAP
jgi:hypothetical protein